MDVVGTYDVMHVEMIDKDAMIAALRQQLADAQAALAASQAASTKSTNAASALNSLLGS